MKIKHFILKKVLILASLSCFVTINTSYASILKDEKELNWVSQRDLTSQQFSSAFNKYKRQGYLMIDVDAYPSKNSTRYSMVWRKNTDGRTWKAHRDMTSSVYHQKWKSYKNQGYRPLDVEAYQKKGTIKWAGIWVKNNEGFAWSSHRNLSSQAYGNLFQQKKQAGYRLADMEAYSTPSGLRYAAIWYKNTDGRAWAQLRNMTRSQYQNELNKRSRQGMMVVDFESYQTSQGQRYAAIWERKRGYASQMRSNRTAKQFANLWRQYRDEGFRLVDFERYNTSSGIRYAGLWVENNSRYRYSQKGSIDNTITNYRSANNLPGISVAIIRNGDMLYQRGFGWADMSTQKVAYSGTIYNSASISKVIGATLAAKLEDESQLRDGTSFNLDLSRATSDYLTHIPNANGQVDLPAFHAHTVEELLSHLGCVGHYHTNPPIRNQTRHYSTAIAAVQSIWDIGLVRGCQIGSTTSYSTPAHTFVAAALEHVTGYSITQLLNNELFKPYQLNSMRAQYTYSSLPTNYDRAVPYQSNNNKTSYHNNSWKVLGGGIESNPVDLAKFAWKVLDAEIVSPNVRDNRLWKRMSPSSYGLGWALGYRDGRRVAEHSGSAIGARSHLRVYRDDGLVIAIMSNRRNHSVDDVYTLASDLANVILN